MRREFILFENSGAGMTVPAVSIFGEQFRGAGVLTSHMIPAILGLIKYVYRVWFLFSDFLVFLPDLVVLGRKKVEITEYSGKPTPTSGHCYALNSGFLSSGIFVPLGRVRLNMKSSSIFVLLLSFFAIFLLRGRALVRSVEAHFFKNITVFFADGISSAIKLKRITWSDVGNKVI